VCRGRVTVDSSPTLIQIAIGEVQDTNRPELAIQTAFRLETRIALFTSVCEEVRTELLAAQSGHGVDGRDTGGRG
jgi:hypothetical protein